MDTRTEESLAGVEMYDDSAILAIFNSALRSHRTKTPRITGEASTGGLSRKQKKRALKESKDESAGDGDGSDLVRGPPPTDLSHLDEVNRSFVEHFLAATDADGGEEGAAGAGEGFAEQQWCPVEGGPYHNCQITVQHHHHYHAHPGRSAEPPSSSSTAWTEQRAEAWAELCAARASYDAALSRFENMSAALFDQNNV